MTQEALIESPPPVSTDTPEAPDTVAIENLDQFVTILARWHAEKVATIKHLLAIPEGSAFEIGTDTLVLTPDVLAGFKFGLEMALMQLGELPFVAEREEAAASDIAALVDKL